jgi:hypothetical protein
MEMKESLVAKMCMPGAVSAYKLSLETGISYASLLNWKQAYRGGITSMKDRRPEDWSAAERLQSVLDSQNLSPECFGEYLRSKGLHSNHIEDWKAEALSAVSSQSKRGRPKLDPELVKAREENTLLKRDLNRKNRALAEQTALVMLKKKAQEIWGDPEDDEY